MLGTLEGQRVSVLLWRDVMSRQDVSQVPFTCVGVTPSLSCRATRHDAPRECLYRWFLAAVRATGAGRGGLYVLFPCLHVLREVIKRL